MLKAVEGELEQKGMNNKTCKEAKIQELTLSATYRLKSLSLSYSPVFSLLTGSRQQRRDYMHYLLWQNTQQELCA